jgi:hypothetical protein
MIGILPRGDYPIFLEVRPGISVLSRVPITPDLATLLITYHRPGEARG